jgi:hypothetical protein
MINKIQYNIHKILWSKYKLLINILILSLIYLSFYGQQIIYCMTEGNDIPVVAEAKDIRRTTSLERNLIKENMELRESLRDQQIEHNLFKHETQQLIHDTIAEEYYERYSFSERSYRHRPSFFDYRSIIRGEKDYFEPYDRILNRDVEPEPKPALGYNYDLNASKYMPDPDRARLQTNKASYDGLYNEYRGVHFENERLRQVAADVIAENKELKEETARLLLSQQRALSEARNLPENFRVQILEQENLRLRNTILEEKKTK